MYTKIGIGHWTMVIDTRHWTMEIDTRHWTMDRADTFMKT